MNVKGGEKRKNGLGKRHVSYVEVTGEKKIRKPGGVGVRMKKKKKRGRRDARGESKGGTFFKERSGERKGAENGGSAGRKQAVDFMEGLFCGLGGRAEGRRREKETLGRGGR